MDNQISRSNKFGIIYNNEVKQLIENIITFDNSQRDYKYNYFYDLLKCLRGQIINQDESDTAIFIDCKPLIMASIEKLLPDNEPTLRKLYETLRDNQNYILRQGYNDEIVVYTRDDVNMEKLGNFYRSITKQILSQYDMLKKEFDQFILELKKDNVMLTIDVPSLLSTPNRTRTIERVRSTPDRFKPESFGLVKFVRRKTPKTINDFLKITSANEVVRILIIVIVIVIITIHNYILGIRVSE